MGGSRQSSGESRGKGHVLPGTMAGVHALPTAHFNMHALNVLGIIRGQRAELMVEKRTEKDLIASWREE